MRFLCMLIFIFLTACSSAQKPAALRFHEANNFKAAQINTQLGIAYLGQNDRDRAKQKLLLALKQDPNLAEAWYAMAFLLEQNGNQQEARTYYLKAIALAPTRGDTQNNYGTYLCRIGDYAGAISHFLLAVKDLNYLETSAAYENAGLCALKIPNFKLAKRYFTKAIQQDPRRMVSRLELQKL